MKNLILIAILGLSIVQVSYETNNYEGTSNLFKPDFGQLKNIRPVLKHNHGFTVNKNIKPLGSWPLLVGVKNKPANNLELVKLPINNSVVKPFSVTKDEKEISTTKVNQEEDDKDLMKSKVKDSLENLKIKGNIKTHNTSGEIAINFKDSFVLTEETVFQPTIVYTKGTIDQPIAAKQSNEDYWESSLEKPIYKENSNCAEPGLDYIISEPEDLKEKQSERYD